MCILYIIETYMKGIPFLFYVFQSAYGVAVLINFIFSFLYSERPIIFMLSLKSLFECLSIPSLLFSSGAKWLNFNFLQAYSILVEWALLEKHDIVMRNNSTLARLLINLVLQLCTFLYVTSCGVQFFELLGDPAQALRSETFQITWANSVYFAVVTLMTVGYGDFVPYTLFGRMWIVLHIIFVAYLVSREISLLIDALKSMRRGGGSYVNSSGIQHVVVTGKVKWDFLTQFVKEFLAEPTNLDTKVVVLASNPTWSDDDWHKFVSRNPFFDHHLMFLEGSALKLDDLMRADVGAAKALFVLADPHCQDPYREDSDILKAVLTIRKFSGSVPVYALNTLQDSSFQFGIAMEHTDPPRRYYDARATGLFPASTSFIGRAEQPSLAQTNARDHSEVSEVQRDRFYGALPESGQGVEGPAQNLSRLDSNAPVDNQGFYSVEETLTATTRRRGTDDLRPSARTRRLRRSLVLRKSEFLCMQELETVLLAENTFCNGLSTLIANATLRVAPQSHYNDRPWLVEYKLGAECSIQQFVIRKEMDGLPYGKVATIMQDYGLVLLAIRRRKQNKWTIISPSTILESEMSTMALSYHDHTVIDRIADIAASFIAVNKIDEVGSSLDRPPPSDAAGPVHRAETRVLSKAILPEKVDGYTGIRFDHPGGMHTTRLVPLAEDPMHVDRNPKESELLSDDADPGNPSPEDSTSAQGLVAGKSFMTRSLSTSTANILKQETKPSEPAKEDPNDALDSSAGDNNIPFGSRRSRSSSPDSRRRILKKSERIIYSGVDKLPAALRGHVIICLDGESPLANLDALLRCIWLPRTGRKKKVPVVVIHPRFPKNFARTLSENRGGLFLLQGNSLSLETLKQAQYHSARAFLIMASERTKGSSRGSTDSKAIFTVMTLDSLLSDQDTFVCCVLDAEDSLQLLRAPRQARRVGVNLGEQIEADLFHYERSPRAAIPRRTTSSTSFMMGLPPSPFVHGQARLAPFGTTAGVFPPFPGARYGNKKNKATRLRLKGMTRSSSMRLEQAFESSDEDSEDENVHTLKEQQSRQLKSREELYERQRYASGELVISSLFTALLARDYTDPGYIRLIRQLIGSSSGSNGSWIRQINIPESWTRAEKAIGGRTYRETASRLLELGCIALGLYRSGDAPVREETSSERWDLVEERRHLQQDDGNLSRAVTGNSLGVGSRMVNNDIYSSRRYSRIGMGRPQEGVGFPEPDIGSNRTSISDRLFSLGDQEDEFDQMYYTCPTTKRRIHYRESVNGENVLPYVYTCPEPYSLVVASDAVFVLCDPTTSIPVDWDEE